MLAPLTVEAGDTAVSVDVSRAFTFGGRVVSFEDVTRHPQNDRTRCLG